MLPLLTLVAATTFATVSAIRLGDRGRRARGRGAKGGSGVDASGSFKVMEHLETGDESLILATEDVPLDNRFGNKVFVSEHDFTRTAVVSVELESGRQMESLTRFGLFEAVKADLQTRLSQDLDLEIGSQLSRHVRVRFSAAPGEMVRYRLTWRQTAQRGVFKVAVGRKLHTIPYLVCHGLSHSVESISVAQDQNI